MLNIEFLSLGNELFFLTHVDERAPAAAIAEERGKLARTLRWVDPGTRWTHLDIVVCIATGTTHQFASPS